MMLSNRTKSLVSGSLALCLTFIGSQVLAGGMEDADKVAHAYVDAWKAGDYNKAIVLADKGHSSITGVRCAEQNSKWNEVTEVLEWGKPEALPPDFVAIKFSVNATDYKGEKRKQDWWIGLLKDDGVWKVGYLNANIRPQNMNYALHKAATVDDGQPQYKFSLNQFTKKVADYKAQK